MKRPVESVIMIQLDDLWERDQQPGGESKGMSEAGARAQWLFSEGYNCAQAVFLAFPEATGLDERTAARLTNCLGGGISGTGSLCGAVSAGCLALSARFGRDNPSREGEHAKRQQATYRLVQEYQEQFRREYGDVLCPALLEKGLAASVEAKNDKFLCPRYVGRGAELVEALMQAEEA